MLLYLFSKKHREDESVNIETRYSDLTQKDSYTALQSGILRATANTLRGTNDDLNCDICYELLEDGKQDLYDILPCRHVFHNVCIQNWFANADAQRRERTCPLCRAVVQNSSVQEDDSPQTRQITAWEVEYNGRRLFEDFPVIPPLIEVRMRYTNVPFRYVHDKAILLADYEDVQDVILSRLQRRINKFNQILQSRLSPAVKNEKVDLLRQTLLEDRIDLEPSYERMNRIIEELDSILQQDAVEDTQTTRPDWLAIFPNVPDAETLARTIFPTAGVAETPEYLQNSRRLLSAYRAIFTLITRTINAKIYEWDIIVQAGMERDQVSQFMSSIRRDRVDLQTYYNQLSEIEAELRRISSITTDDLETFEEL